MCPSFTLSNFSIFEFLNLPQIPSRTYHSLFLDLFLSFSLFPPLSHSLSPLTHSLTLPFSLSPLSLLLSSSTTNTLPSHAVPSPVVLPSYLATYPLILKHPSTMTHHISTQYRQCNSSQPQPITWQGTRADHPRRPRTFKYTISTTLNPLKNLETV